MKNYLPLTRWLIAFEIFCLAMLLILIVAAISSAGSIITIATAITLALLGVLGLVLAFIQTVSSLININDPLRELHILHLNLLRKVRNRLKDISKWLVRPGIPRWLLIVVLLAVPSLILAGMVYQKQQDGIRLQQLIKTPTAVELVTLQSDQQPIGISDGRYVFDLRPDSGPDVVLESYQRLKKEGADAFKKGNFQLARQDWTQAVKLRGYSNDAETLIDLENLRVKQGQKPSVSFIFVTQLTGNENVVNRGRDDLQGAYVALEEFNHRKNAQFLATLQIANIGDQDQYVDIVKDRIISIQRRKPTFAGIIGWPEHNDRVNQALSDLCAEHIPSITISSAGMTNLKSDCEFSVAPSSDAEAATAADFAISRLHAHKVSIIFDPANLYSQGIADSFSNHFRADSPSTHRVVDKEHYTQGNGNSLGGLVRATLHGEPDLIYYVGYPNDISIVLKELVNEDANINVLSTNILYQAPHYPNSVEGNNGNLYFTAFAHPDEWKSFSLTQEPAFINDYGNDFDPENIYDKGTYGFERANNDVLLSYDAMCTALEATLLPILKSGETTSTSETHPTAKELLEALPHIEFQGITGRIQYDSDDNLMNKAVIVVSIDAQGRNSFANYIEGSYTCSSCSQFLRNKGDVQ